MRRAALPAWVGWGVTVIVVLACVAVWQRSKSAAPTPVAELPERRIGTTPANAEVNVTPRPEPSATPMPQDGRRLLSDLQCPGLASDHRERRLLRPPDSVLETEWANRLCDLTISPSERMSQPFDIGSGELASLSLTETWVHHFPGIADSNSPVFWAGGSMIMFNSFAWPSVATGASVEELGQPTSVEIHDRTGDGGRWLQSVWFDESDETLYGWYHREPELECLTAPVIGAAVSIDYGVTWSDRGVVIRDPDPSDCSYENGYFTGGSGDFSVILDPTRRYFYFLYTNYGGSLEQQGIGIARSRFEDRGQPGTLQKWNGSDWSEPGLGGETYPLFPAVTSWAESAADSLWGPSLHWNVYLLRYVVFLNRALGPEWEQEGIYVSFSSDLLTWTRPEKVLSTNYWYAQVVGLAAGETDSLVGQSARLYVGGMSPYLLEFTR